MFHHMMKTLTYFLQERESHMIDGRLKLQYYIVHALTKIQIKLSMTLDKCVVLALLHLMCQSTMLGQSGKSNHRNTVHLLIFRQKQTPNQMKM